MHCNFASFRKAPKSSVTESSPSSLEGLDGFRGGGGGVPPRTMNVRLDSPANDPCVAISIAAGTGRAQLALKTGALALGRPGDRPYRLFYPSIAFICTPIATLSPRDIDQGMDSIFLPYIIVFTHCLVYMHLRSPDSIYTLGCSGVVSLLAFASPQSSSYKR